jgi:uncharacterized membrane protein
MNDDLVFLFGFLTILSFVSIMVYYRIIFWEFSFLLSLFAIALWCFCFWEIAQKAKMGRKKGYRKRKRTIEQQRKWEWTHDTPSPPQFFYSLLWQIIDRKRIL